MTNAVFITEDYLKENTIINGNVDNKYLLSNLKMIEDVYIHPLLGTNLFTELRDQVTSGQSYISDANKDLIEEYIQPCLIYYLLSELPYDMVFKWENKSIVRKNSEFSVSADVTEIQKIAAQKRKIADHYAKRLSEFLCANIATYPKYSTQTRSDAIHPEHDPYKYGGIYLG